VSTGGLTVSSGDLIAASIKSASTGDIDLVIKPSGTGFVKLQDSDGNNKLATTSGGVSISGTVTGASFGTTNTTLNNTSLTLGADGSNISTVKAQSDKTLVLEGATSGGSRVTIPAAGGTAVSVSGGLSVVGTVTGASFTTSNTTLNNTSLTVGAFDSQSTIQAQSGTNNLVLRPGNVNSFIILQTSDVANKLATSSTGVDVYGTLKVGTNTSLTDTTMTVGADGSNISTIQAQSGKTLVLAGATSGGSRLTIPAAGGSAVSISGGVTAFSFGSGSTTLTSSALTVGANDSQSTVQAQNGPNNLVLKPGDGSSFVRLQESGGTTRLETVAGGVKITGGLQVIGNITGGLTLTSAQTISGASFTVTDVSGNTRLFVPSEVASSSTITLGDKGKSNRIAVSDANGVVISGNSGTRISVPAAPASGNTAVSISDTANARIDIKDQGDIVLNAGANAALKVANGGGVTILDNSNKVRFVTPGASVNGIVRLQDESGNAILSADKNGVIMKSGATTGLTVDSTGTTVNQGTLFSQSIKSAAAGAVDLNLASTAGGNRITIPATSTNPVSISGGLSVTGNFFIPNIVSAASGSVDLNLASTAGGNRITIPATSTNPVNISGNLNLAGSVTLGPIGFRQDVIPDIFNNNANTPALRIQTTNAFGQTTNNYTRLLNTDAVSLGSSPMNLDLSVNSSYKADIAGGQNLITLQNATSGTSFNVIASSTTANTLSLSTYDSNRAAISANTVSGKQLITGIVHDVTQQSRVIAGNTASSQLGSAAASARLGTPMSSVIDAAGNLYVGEYSSYRIRKIDPFGEVSTIVGNGTPGFNGDGLLGVNTQISRGAVGLALDTSNNVYFSDQHNHLVRKLTASTGVVSTVAGSGFGAAPNSNGGGYEWTASTSRLSLPTGLRFDSTGNMYIADTENHRIRKVWPDGNMTTLIGSGTAGNNGSQYPLTTHLRSPQGIVLDSTGNMYIADQGNNLVRKWTVSGGIMSIVAGTGFRTATGEGGYEWNASGARLHNPKSMVFDSVGNMYVADANNHRVRKIWIDGNITTYAGNGVATTPPSTAGDGGQATSASLNTPVGLAFDENGNLFIGEYYGNRIRKVNVSTGIITTFAGDGTTASASAINNPAGIAYDPVGQILYVAEYGGNRIRRVTSAGAVTTFTLSAGPFNPSELKVGYVVVGGVTFRHLFCANYGNGTLQRYNISGSPASSNVSTLVTSLNGPSGVAVDSVNNYLYVTETGGPPNGPNTVRRYALDGTGGVLIAGGAREGNGGDGGLATSASLSYPGGLAINPTNSNNLYITESGNQRIRNFTVGGNINHFAGNSLGNLGYLSDNLATDAQLNSPTTVALNTAGTELYIADRLNNRIRKVVLSNGLISTLAGSNSGGNVPLSGNTGDTGSATSATLSNPVAIGIDSGNNVYIGDSGNNRIRKIAASVGNIGTIITSFINSTQCEAISFDSSNNVISCDTGAHTVRRTPPGGTPTTILAGTNATSGSTGDGGLATSARLNSPGGAAVDAAGNLYIADANNNRVRRVVIGGNITHFAGSSTGIGGYLSDNLATDAQLYFPAGIALDTTANILYIADQFNARIRQVNLGSGVISTLAGVFPPLSGNDGDGSAATSARLNLPLGVEFDTLSPQGIYITDTGNQRIRKIIGGNIFHFAGSPAGTAGSTGSGVNASGGGVTFNSIQSSKWDSRTNSLYVSDTNNHAVRVINSSGIINTFAGALGTLGNSGDGGLAVDARIHQPGSVSIDGVGKVYISLMNNNRIRVVDSGSQITNYAGLSTGVGGYNGDTAAGLSARLVNMNPSNLVFDSSGNLYFSDTTNHRVRKIDRRTGAITTVVGTGVPGNTGDNGGLPTAAQLNTPRGLAFDAAGNLYIADTGNNRVRRATIGAGIVNFAGSSAATAGNTGDGGSSFSALLNTPRGLAFDSVNNVMYIADTGNNRVRRVVLSTQIISNFAGSSGGSSGNAGNNGLATSALLTAPQGVAMDSANGILYIADTGNNQIRKVFLAAVPMNIELQVVSNSPSSIVIDSINDEIIFTNTSAMLIRKCPSSSNTATTIAGTGTAGFSGDGGVGTSAQLNVPTGIARDSAGNLYIGDTNNNRIRLLDKSTSLISTYAGSGTAAFIGDLPVTAITTTDTDLNYPTATVTDFVNKITYITDTFNHVVRKITDGSGTTTVIAGTIGIRGNTGDTGPATSALLNYPRGIALDSVNGVLYITDTGNNRVRKITLSSGIISNFAGSSVGTAGNAGDGSTATSASLNAPRGLALDSSNNLYIADTGNNRIRRVLLSTGVISNFAGSSAGTAGNTGDGSAATSALLNGPRGIVFDSSNNLYIADTNNNRIRRVVIAGNITNFAGNLGGTAGRTVTGTATTSYLSSPTGVSFASQIPSGSRIFIADSSNSRILSVDISAGTISLFTPDATPSTDPLNGLAGTRLHTPTSIEHMYYSTNTSSSALLTTDPVNCNVKKIFTA
jgi:sugar lactone lactonase YvrE